MPNALPSPSQAASFDGQAFLMELAAHIGLDADTTIEMTQGLLFSSAQGLPMRMHLATAETKGTLARVEVLLPLTSRELMGHEVERLLTLQASLIADGGWWLSTAPEGVLNLTCLPWLESVAQAKEAMDAAIVLAPLVVKSIAFPEVIS